MVAPAIMKSFIETAQHLGVQRLLALSRGTKQKLFLVFDFFVAASAWALVVPRLNANGIAQGLGFTALVILISYRLSLYRAVLRFAGVRVVWVIGQSYALASVIAAFWHLIANELMPLASYLSLALFGTGLAAGTRILVREALFQSASRQKDAVIIYGAGDAGRQLLTAITQSQTMRAVALVDDDPVLEGAEFHGVRVCPPDVLPRLCKQHQVQTVILALPNLSRSRRAQVLQALEQLSVQIRSMPRITDILAGRREVLDLEVVSIEELLGA